MEHIVFWAIWVVLGIGMSFYYLRRRHVIRSLLRGMLTGVAALFLMHYFGNWIGFSPEINLFNLMQAAVLGIPGVILLTVVHFFV